MDQSKRKKDIEIIYFLFCKKAIYICVCVCVTNLRVQFYTFYMKVFEPKVCKDHNRVRFSTKSTTSFLRDHKHSYIQSQTNLNKSKNKRK